MPGRDAGRCVVGVDFGTLSARAVVVRVDDGAEIGTAMHAYRHGVIDRRLPSSGEELPPDWALQDPRDYVESIAEAVRGAVRDASIDPTAVIGIGTDFTACTMLPTFADGTPLCRARGVRRPSSCLREAVEAPCCPATGRSHQRAGRRARRAVAARATAG